jgi:hypothetical protein
MGTSCEKHHDSLFIFRACGPQSLNVVLENTGNTVLAGRWRLKPRLKGLRPRNPPSRVAETCPRWERRWVGSGSGSGQSAQADFVAERAQHCAALQARLQSPAALACPHYFLKLHQPPAAVMSLLGDGWTRACLTNRGSSHKTMEARTSIAR